MENKVQVQDQVRQQEINGPWVIYKRNKFLEF